MTRLLNGLRRRESPSVLSGDLSRPSVENVVYALTAACLLAGPVVAAGLSGTIYGLFLVVVLARAGYLSPDA